MIQVTDEKKAFMRSISKRLIPAFCRGWDVDIKFGELNFPDTISDCRLHFAERQAHITLDYRLPLEDLGQCIAHEIAHVAVADLDRMVFDYIAIKASKSEVEYVTHITHNQRERTIDTIAEGMLKLIGHEAGTKGWLTYKEG